MKHNSSCKCDRCRRTIELRKAQKRREFERSQGNLFAKLAPAAQDPTKSRTSGHGGGDAA